jgi:hypothetical protein
MIAPFHRMSDFSTWAIIIIIIIIIRPGGTSQPELTPQLHLP